MLIESEFSMSFNRKPPLGNVRRVGHVGGSNNIPGNRTNKAGRRVQFESFAEKRLTLRLDRDPTVIDYESQPGTFEFIGKTGKNHQYTPDFKVWKCDGSIEIHEVTLTERREKPAGRRREEAAHRICAERGWRYIVHVEETLPQTTETANLLALSGYQARVYYKPEIAQSALRTLHQHQKMALRRLAQQVACDDNIAYPKVVSTLVHMVWHRILEADLTQMLIFIDSAINPQALVWLPKVEKE
jgi:hypothetical protein